MSYTKQNFKNGTVLTAEALNAMDNQIAKNEIHTHDDKYQPKGDYVVAEEGKGLSTNDFTDDDKYQVYLMQELTSDVGDINERLKGLGYEPGDVKIYIDTELGSKADYNHKHPEYVVAVEGKGLSTNDFTDDYKGSIQQIDMNLGDVEARLEGLPENQGGVKTYIDESLSGKAESDHDHDDKYQPKGDYVVAEEGKGLSTNDFTDDYKSIIQQTDMDLRDVEIRLEGFSVEDGSVKAYIDSALEDAGAFDVVELGGMLQGFDSAEGSVKTYIDTATDGALDTGVIEVKSTSWPQTYYSVDVDLPSMSENSIAFLLPANFISYMKILENGITVTSNIVGKISVNRTMDLIPDADIKLYYVIVHDNFNDGAEPICSAVLAAPPSIAQSIGDSAHRVMSQNAITQELAKYAKTEDIPTVDELVEAVLARLEEDTGA